jgi:hypothetical protein
VHLSQNLYSTIVARSFAVRTLTLLSPPGHARLGAARE